MKKGKWKNVVIVILSVIVVALMVLLVHIYVNIFPHLSMVGDSENLELENNIQSEKEELNNENKVSREEIVAKLKEALTNEEWIKDNLYASVDCFGNKIENSAQDLSFSMLSDEENNPIVIVYNFSVDLFISICYKVYYNDGNILVQTVSGVDHPAHVGYSLDKNQGFVIASYVHMGYFIYTVYDIKGDEIKMVDKYDCSCVSEDVCNYEECESKLSKYNSSYDGVELTMENVNSYIK